MEHKTRRVGLRSSQRYFVKAARRGDTPRLIRMLSEGADVNQRGRSGKTALLAAVMHGHEAAAMELLRRGADPNIPSHDGTWPLHLVESLALLKAFVEAGAHLQVRDRDGFTPFYQFVQAVYIQSGSLDMARFLAERGVDVDVESHSHERVLCFAACWNYHERVAFLLSLGLNADQREVDNGYTALIYAAKEGHLAAVRLLLQHSANPNLADVWGRTPLMHASQFGSAATVRMLLAAGATVDALDNKGHTALDLAAEYAGRDVVSIMQKAESTSTWVRRAWLDGEERIQVGSRHGYTEKANHFDEVVALLTAATKAKDL